MEIENVKSAVEILEKSEDFADLIPEVRSNIVMAKKDAHTIEDVVGIPGRITRVNNKPKVFTKPEYGASSHMARLVLSMMKYYPSKRSALNFRYDKKLIDICTKLGLNISYYDRSQEPEDIRKVEGGTIPWGVKSAIERIGKVPDVIYHTGDWGKEPSIVLIGENAIEVAKTAVCISRLYNVTEGYDVLFAPSRGSYPSEKPDVQCLFCSIAKNDPKVPSKVLYNDGENMVIMNIFPYNRGHLEVVPVNHFTDLNELEPESLKNLFIMVQKTIKLIRAVMEPAGINVGINLGKTAGASVEHLHIHVLPRFRMESGFMETLANTRVIEESIDETYAKYMEKIQILKE
ncbi:MAG: thiamine-phosphate synthase family protein [Methanomicrobiales archaeon]